MSIIHDATPIRGASGWKPPSKMKLDNNATMPYLLSYVPDTYSLAFEKVLDWVRNPAVDNVMCLEHDKGVVVCASTAHVLTADFEWIPVGGLEPEDDLIYFKDARSLERKECKDHKAALSKARSQIKAVYYLTGYSCNMYGFRVDGPNSFVADGLIFSGF